MRVFLRTNKMNTTRLGDISEAKILAKLLEHGYVVLKPWSNNSRYDLVADKDDKFFRVQCKTGKLREGSIVFKTCSINRTKNGVYVAKSYAGQIDFFGVYCFELDKCYLIPASDVEHQESAKLKVTPHKSPIPRHNIRWASGYEL